MNTGNLNVLSKLSAYIIDKLQDNIMLNAFRIAINGSLTQFNMIDGIVDEYEDESGIDTVNSVNESYDSTDDYYSPLSRLPSSEYSSDANTQLLLHCNGTDTSTTFIDSGNTGHTVTANGNAQLDTAQKKFGTASGRTNPKTNIQFESGTEEEFYDAYEKWEHDKSIYILL